MKNREKRYNLSDFELYEILNDFNIEELKKYSSEDGKEEIMDLFWKAECDQVPNPFNAWGNWFYDDFEELLEHMYGSPNTRIVVNTIQHGEILIYKEYSPSGNTYTVCDTTITGDSGNFLIVGKGFEEDVSKMVEDYAEKINISDDYRTFTENNIRGLRVGYQIKDINTWRTIVKSEMQKLQICGNYL